MDAPSFSARGGVMHKCEPKCANDPKNADGYGAAITSSYEAEDGKLWAGNEEYGSRVNFCPFCGYKAKVEVE